MQVDRPVVVRCRALILNKGKLFVVKHPHNTSFAALPGGKLEWGETPEACMHRELIEELGIEPKVGALQYVYTFLDGDIRQSVEFFFHIENGEAYEKCGETPGTHAHEIAEMLWVEKGTDEHILPEVVKRDFNNGTLISNEIRFEKE